MKMLRQHLLLIFFLSSLGLFLVCNVSIWQQSKNFDFEIKDITGDRTCLTDLSINGIIADNVHKETFKIQNNKKDVTVSALSPSMIWSETISNDYKTHADRNIYNIRFNKVTGRTYRFTRFDEEVEVKGETVGGAYDITKLVKNKTERKTPFGVGKNIAPIDLESGKVRILEMEALGNILLFVTSVDLNIVLKPFDLSQNKFLDDIDFHQKERMNFNYNYYASCDDHYISMVIPVDDPKLSSNKIVYDINAHKIVMDCVEDDTLAPFPKILKYKNNTLYVLTQYTYEPDKHHEDVINDHSKLRMTAYQDDKKIYTGEFICNIEDDYHYTAKPDANGYINMNIPMYRNNRELYELSLE